MKGAGPLTHIRWDEQGAPHSVAFEDKYFCKYNGYEEAIVVNLVGNRLRERLLALDPKLNGTFTIIETGFGTGLDFCCVWELWNECAPLSWTLNFVSLELYPLPVAELVLALDLWPILASFRKTLAAQYAPEPGAVQKMSFDNGRVCLTIVFDDVVAALRRIKEDRLAPEGADVWFFDGFAPSKNPEMWSSGVFKGAALLSRSGTTLSTFSVAGFVRRGLEAEGFVVSKIPGYGKKNHILTGFFKGKPQ